MDSKQDALLKIRHCLHAVFFDYNRKRNIISLSIMLRKDAHGFSAENGTSCRNIISLIIMLRKDAQKL